MAPKNTRTFQIVGRSLHDPKFHEQEDAGGVFVEVKGGNAEKKSRGVSRAELEKMHDKFAAEGRRENEGEAALYGITFDDSKYDYMQHMRRIGETEDAYFIGVDGKVTDSYVQPDVKDRLTLTDLLNGEEVKDKDVSFYEHVQSQLPVQDALAGLNPNMDPRLREVLEALEDEEYVDEDLDADEELFSQLIQTGEVKDEKEWARLAPEERPEDLEQREGEEDWEFAFRKFKISSQNDDNYVGSDFGSDDFGSEPEHLQSDEARDTVGELPNVPDKNKKKKKKKIGAKTDLSGYSMSSSANYRNEGLTLLDDTFERVEEEYAQPSSDDEEEEFDMSKERPDLESIMDEFLDDFVVQGKHLYKRTK